MQLLKDEIVLNYVSFLGGKSLCHFKRTVCQCLNKHLPPNAHVERALPFDKNLVEFSIVTGPSISERPVLMDITKNFYFDADTMKFLIHRMLSSKDVETVEQCYGILEKNFNTHPPCASYMDEEYEKLILVPYRGYFGGMTLWDYFFDCFNRIVNGSLLYSDDPVFELAFKNSFSFCVCILQTNYEVSKKYNFRPLIMKCLKFNPERRTRMSRTTKLLDMLFNSGYDFQSPIIDLALLVHKILVS